MKSTLLILVGMSGSGKTHTLKTLKENFGYEEIIQYTSRPMRSYEIDTEDYYFVTSDELKDSEKFIVKKYETVFGSWFYGIHKESLLNSLKESNKRQILVTDIYSAIEIRELLSNNNFDSKIIFLNPPVQTILDRLKERGDNSDEIDRRLMADLRDYQYAHSFSDLEIAEESHRKIIKTIKRFMQL